MKNLDYYALRPRLFFLSKERYPTNMGLVMTVIIIISLFLIFLSFAQRTFYHIDPYLISSQKYHKEIPLYNLKSKDFNVVFFFHYNGIEYINDPSILKVNASIIKYLTFPNGTTNANETPVMIEACTKEMLSLYSGEERTLKETLQRTQFEKNFCLSSNEMNVELAGTYGMEIFSMLQVFFIPCSNSTREPGEPVCQNQTYIEEVLKFGYFGVNLLQNIVDLENFENPTKKSLTSMYTRSSETTFRELHAYMKSVRIKTDHGTVREDITEDRFLTLSAQKEIVVARNQGSYGAIGMVTIRMDILEEVWDRKYDKLQEVVAKTGRFLS